MAETNAENVILQAHEWNFQGDCSLLQWMKQISQNMEQRASSTICALEQLNVDVRKTSTALDNAANSLTALQYTQFVESRCHDDDETSINTNAGVMDAVKNNEEPQSSSVVLKTFLNKNLEMLRNCHEKYTLDLEDSDEEEGANNCIYQPQNPYNERFLPHIFGSKLWKENWHVGLCDSANDYSGDEVSEAFSETSTTSLSAVEDNESYDSNTPANLTEWASNTSLSNGRCLTTTAAMAVQNDYSQGGSHHLFPPISSLCDKQERAFATGSDTSSTTSHTIPPRQQNNEHDLFVSLHNTPPTSTTSSLSSSAATLQQTPNPTLISNKQSVYLGANSSAKNISTAPQMFFDQIPEDDLFAGTTAESERVSTKTASEKTNSKPVNLFDDDDFNSFMTEIVEKPTPVAAARRPLISANAPIAAPEKINTSAAYESVRKQVVDLFDSPTKEAEKTEPKIIKPVTNLFESSEDCPTDKTLFPRTAQESKNDKFDARTKINVKSLFDDDDEDDDFLNIFGSKNINIPKINEKIILFDDERGGNKIEQISSVNNMDLFGDNDKNSELKTAPVTIDKNKIDVFASGDNSNKSENEQINFEEAKMQKDIESNAKPILEDSRTVNNPAEESTNKAVTTDLFGHPSKPWTFIDRKDSMNNNTNNISEQKLGTVKDKLTKVKLTPNLFEESDEFDDLFEKPKTYNSNKSLRNEPIEVPSIINETNNQISTLKDIDVNLEKSYQNVKSIEEVTEEISAEVVKDDLNDPEIRTQLGEQSALTELTTSVPDIFVESTVGKVKDDIDFPLKSDSIFVQKDTEIGKPLIKVPTANSYTGIFLDEPPDDDFFQSLQSSSTKLSLDLDHEFYEPVLPQIPSNVQKESLNKTDTTPAVNDYGGLCLFSDVPPDDDGHLMTSYVNVDDTVGEIKTSTSITNQLGNVFYDDFNETLEAVQQRPGEISKLSHALFDDEPPPDDNAFNVVDRVFETDSIVNVKTSTTNEGLPDTKKQSASPVKAELSQNYENNRLFKKQTHVFDEVDRPRIGIEKSSITVDEIPKMTNSRETVSISKLQMPNININVQALLPNVGRKPSLQRSAPEESHTHPKKSENNILYPAYIEPIAQEPKENILTNVCKTRVRAPAKRRPSTRRGRQENYRKSLLEEQEQENLEEPAIKGEFTEKPNLQNTNSITDVKRNQSTEIRTLKQPKQVLPKYNENPNHTEIDSSTSINKTLSALFPDNEEGDEKLFKPQPITLKSPNIPIGSKDSLFLPTSPDDSIFDEIKQTITIEKSNKTFSKTSAILKPFENDGDGDLFEGTKNVTEIVKSNIKSASKDTSSFPYEQNDSDDELFKSTNPSRTKTAKLPPPFKSTVTKVAASLFGSDEDSNDDDFMSALRKGAKSKGAIKKPETAKQESSKGKSLFSDVESDDDDDLFGGGAIKSTTKIASKSLQLPLGKQAEPTTSLTSESMLENNPLADLLNS